ncbi:sugar ABC transporter ATP-binding protein [Thermomicrobium sp. 4228-Ro]|uniref:sugar ABC transporter ATP-binding protein n=1 Tax=Thermomicrobium sp. 4228-Ro TaxID=2993937 RepID=UPI0022492F51|nr:sugar ABC transporter ATP-binding protein [Thermomicrobium sp. 4228-Ro]MCX2728029.1 sugar ABC transporter ATP-binding protein [Thermomicrobium sp. 4228-Ro]
MPALLRAHEISKRFPGVLALDRVSFELQAGEVHALVGENGAGKSTLVNIFAGSLRPDSGTIELEGRPVQIRSPHHAQQLGIRAVFQQLSLVPALTVAENIFLGRELTAPVVLRKPAMQAQSLARLGLFDAGIAPTARVRDLTVPQRYLVEIAKATLEQPKVLILDEPTASLTDRETQVLFGLVRELRERGVGIIWITHRLEELCEIADRVTVMRDGRHVATLAVGDTTTDRLITLMTGREYEQIYPVLQPVPEDAPVALEVQGLHTVHGLRGVHFTLRAGEILGVGGLIGSGKQLIGRALVGLEPATAGQIELAGQRVPLDEISPYVMLHRGLMYFPADRRNEGLLTNRSVLENMTIAALEQFELLGALLDKRRERRTVLDFIRRLAIVPPNPDMRVRNLSGGNQQKVALARGLIRETRVFVLDEPTQGIDVGAKIAIYELLHELARQGAAVLFITSDILELLHVCHRVAVMFQGELVAIVPHEEATEERLLQYYFGHLREEVGRTGVDAA